MAPGLFSSHLHFLLQGEAEEENLKIHLKSGEEEVQILKENVAMVIFSNANDLISTVAMAGISLL